MVREGLWVAAYRVEPADAATAARMFGFVIFAAGRIRRSPKSPPS
jgi:hypothetical protein